MGFHMRIFYFPAFFASIASRFPKSCLLITTLITILAAGIATRIELRNDFVGHVEGPHFFALQERATHAAGAPVGKGPARTDGGDDANDEQRRDAINDRIAIVRRHGDGIVAETKVAPILNGHGQGGRHQLGGKDHGFVLEMGLPNVPLERELELNNIGLFVPRI